MSEVQKSKGLIIDFRCYPSEFTVFTLSKSEARTLSADDQLTVSSHGSQVPKVLPPLAMLLEGKSRCRDLGAVNEADLVDK